MSSSTFSKIWITVVLYYVFLIKGQNFAVWLTDSSGASSLQQSFAFVVLAGHRAVMPCSTNLSRPASWSFLSVARTIPDTVFVNGRLVKKTADNYHMDISSTATGGRQYNLVVRSVKTKDAGQYVCRENNGRAGERFWATELVVLTESHMNCWENYTHLSEVHTVHEDIVVSECSFSFSGNLMPTVSWTDSTGRQVSVRTSGTRKDVGGTVHQYVKTSAVVTSENETTGPFTCSVGFTVQAENSQLANIDKPETDQTKTTNTTQYMYTWPSSGSHVKFVGVSVSRRHLFWIEMRNFGCLLAISTVSVLVFLLVSECLRKRRSTCEVSNYESDEVFRVTVDKHEKDHFVAVGDKVPMTS